MGRLVRSLLEVVPRRSAVFSTVAGVLPILVSVVLLAILLFRVENLGVLLEIRRPYLPLALAASLTINVFFGAYKWRRVIALSGIRTGYWEIWRIWVGLYPITFLMPFQSGHVLYAIALKKAKNVSYFAAFESVGYDKYLNVVATVALIAVGQFVIDPDHVLARRWIMAGALAVVAFYLLDFRILRALSRFEFVRRNSRLVGAKQGPVAKLVLLGLAMIYQSSDLISMYLAFLMLGATAPPQVILGVYPIIVLLSYVPVTFSGFGAREGLIALWMSRHLGYDQAIATGLLIDFLEYLAPALFGLVAFHHVYRLLTRASDLPGAEAEREAT